MCVRLFSTLAVMLWLLASILSQNVRAHGVVGQRLFVEPIATEDANIFSEYDLIVPSYLKGDDADLLSFGTALTLRLTENLGVELEADYVHLNPEIGSTESGFANPELVLKYQMFTSPRHEWVATGALIAEFPFGAEEIGADDFYAFGTGFFFGKGFGDLPEGWRYLRPLMVQGDLVVEHHLTRETDESFNRLAYDLAIYYSLPYLQQFVKDVGLPWPLSRLFPMVELNFERVLNGADRGRQEAFIRPGMVWVGGAVQFGLAAILPMNDHTREEADVGVTGIVSFYLDDLMPDRFAKPLLGF